MGPRQLDQDQLAAALNEWMRRYVDEPEAYAREFQTVADFLAQQSAGETPTYGQECSAYLLKLSEQLGEGHWELSPAAEAALEAGLESAKRGEFHQPWDEINNPEAIPPKA